MTMKYFASITFACEAPDDADAWGLARDCTTTGALMLGRHGCRDIKPDIIKVTANGKTVTFKPKTKPKS